MLKAGTSAPGNDGRVPGEWGLRLRRREPGLVRGWNSPMAAHAQYGGNTRQRQFYWSVSGSIF